MVIDTPQTGEDTDVIIEFREPPLLARPTESRAKMRANAAALDSLSTRLATDLSRASGVVRRSYRVAFSGASARVATAALPAIAALP